VASIRALTRHHEMLARLLPTGFILLLWEIVTRAGLVNEHVFPPVTGIVLRWLGMWLDGTMFMPLGQTLFRALVGLTGAILIGIPVGLLMGRIAWLERCFEPLFSFAFPLPKIALIPLYVTWFGLFSFSKVMLVFTECLFPIVILTYHGARGVSQIYIWSAQARGTRPVSMLWRVALPLSLASIFDGLQIAIVSAVLVAVVTEMISGGGGLGYMMIRAFRSGDVRSAFAVLLTISLIGAILFRAAQSVRARVLFWYVAEA
jgi:ABC-type nitrate/sulfonate/bicarbonate transport system permease component